MNKGIHLDLDTWIVPGQILKANPCRGLGNNYKPAGTEVLIWPHQCDVRGLLRQGHRDWHAAGVRDSTVGIGYAETPLPAAVAHMLPGWSHATAALEAAPARAIR